MPDEQDFVDRALARMGLPRTRENYLYALFGGDPIPEDWGPVDEERNLPPDLRLLT